MKRCLMTRQLTVALVLVLAGASVLQSNVTAQPPSTFSPSAAIQTTTTTTTAGDCIVTVTLNRITSAGKDVGNDWSFYVQADIHGSVNTIRVPDGVAASIIGLPFNPGNVPAMRLPVHSHTPGPKGGGYKVTIIGVAVEDDTAFLGSKNGIPALPPPPTALPKRNTWKDKSDDLGEKQYGPKNLNCPQQDANVVPVTLTIDVIELPQVKEANLVTEQEGKTGDKEQVTMELTINLDP